MNPILSLANGNNWFSVNRDIARAVGLNAAIMLSEVINKYEFFKEKGSLENGWFYLTIEDAEERTTLARDAGWGNKDPKRPKNHRNQTNGDALKKVFQI